jgi:MFS family permease
MERFSESERKGMVKRSLHYSIMDGSFYAAMVGFGESFFSAFAVFLNATSTQLGLLGSLPLLLGSVLQLLSNRLMAFFGSRKRLVVVSSSLQALMYVLVALVFFFGKFRVWLLILFVCIYWVFGNIFSPAWNSWMGDLVSDRARGAYFGRRNRITGFMAFATFTAGGYLLQQFADGTLTQYIGFAMLFLLALVSRIVSVVYLEKKYEPELRISGDAQFSFMRFLREAGKHNYGIFVLYLGFMYFSVYIAAPFFTPFMLSELGFDYVTFTVITATAIVVKFLAMPVWGKLSDMYGSRKVLTISGFMMPLVPLLWIFSHEVWYLVAIQAFSGFAWAGFELASFSFIFDTTTPEKRATCTAYNNVVMGVMIFLGAMMGSAVIKYVSIPASVYYLVFLMSYVARSLSSIFFLPHLRERRQVKSISYKRLVFKAVQGMPTMGMALHLITFGLDEKIEKKK